MKAQRLAIAALGLLALVNATMTYTEGQRAKHWMGEATRYAEQAAHYAKLYRDSSMARCNDAAERRADAERRAAAPVTPNTCESLQIPPQTKTPTNRRRLFAQIS